MNKNTLNQTLLRPLQYRFEDGIIELSTGGTFILAGLYFYMQVVWQNSQVAEWLSSVFVLIFLGGWYLTQYAIRSLKERLTYPRTGYVVYRQGQSNRAVMIAAAVGFGILTAALLAFSQIILPFEVNLLPPFTGFIIAVVCGLTGFKAALPRFYLIAAASLILGGVFAISPMRNDLAFSAFCGVIGLALLVSGGLTLRNYIRQNPIHADAADD